MNGGPGAIRTPDPQIRSLMLYPAELRVRLPCGEDGSLAGGSGGRKRGNAVSASEAVGVAAATA